jgi:D-serine deaminase-like pyridoxal phosphate-dependent protein
VLDLPTVESNIETMHRFFRNRAAKVRNVTKGQKCPALAQRQMAADGAIPFGLCCAKVSEAEVMVDAGAQHVRMIEQVVSTAKIERLMDLARAGYM